VGLGVYGRRFKLRLGTPEYYDSTTGAFGTQKNHIMSQNCCRIEGSQFCDSFESYHKFWGAEWALISKIKMID